MNTKIALTGIKPTGMPHIGNYFGAIKPAIALAEEYEARYFIADYHALNTIKDPETLRANTYEVAAVWLACGLEPDRMLFYKQSSVPETFELSTILMAFTAKGLMNRAHAYKAVVAENTERGKDPDFGVNMGLFTYPVLMAADILLFDADVVPVGKDQQQHLEMTADMAESVNSAYDTKLLTIPAAGINESTQTVTGLDGRKMSKSYNNTIPLFAPAKKLRKTVMKIVTTSQSVEDPKDPDTCNVFALYKLFASQEEQEEMRRRYRAGGMGWGDAKQALFEAMDTEIAPMRAKYDQLMADTGHIEEILREGSRKARELASAKLRDLRTAIGIDR
jgi:tryptophanyl-tRNA synthetase